MPRGRRPNTDPPIRTEVQVPQSVLVQVDLLLVDPVRNRPAYGARSKLVTKLLRNWLTEVKQKRVSPNEITGGN